MKTLEFLTSKEWSMGNGQCPECCGVHAGWHGHPLYLTTENIGHKTKCPLAESIKELGGTALMQGEMRSDKQYETFFTPAGLLSTRVKEE